VSRTENEQWTHSGGPDMEIAAVHLSVRMAARNRARLNEVAEEVFVSHAGQPADVVLEILVRKSTSAAFEPKPDYLRAAAKAISLGRRFAFV
jgi:hypothetical protein